MPTPTVVQPIGSLKTRITLFTLIIFMVSLWSLTLYASHMLRQDMERQLSYQQFSVVSFLAKAVDTHLRERIQALEMVADTIAPEAMDNQPMLQSIFNKRPVLQTLFSGGLLVTDAQGTTIAETPRTLGRIGVNFMDRKAVAGVLLNGTSTVGSPVLDKRLAVPVIGIAVPIRDSSGRTIGTLAGVIALRNAGFLDQLTQSAYGQTGSYFLVDRQERLIIASTKKERILQPLPPRGVTPAIDRFVDGFEGSQVYINAFNVEVLNSVKRLTTVDWGISASISTAETFAPIHAMQQRMVLAALWLSVLAGGLTWWLLRRELSPLSDTTRILAQMATSTQLPQPLPVERKDEIGVLIESFNRLLQSLGEQQSALEGQLRLFSTFMDALPNPVFIKNNETVFTACNTAYEEAFGTQRSQLIGKTVLELDYLPMAAREAFQAADVALIAQGGQTVEEIELIFNDGLRHTLLYQRRTFDLGSGKGGGMLGLMMDISERKERDDYRHFHSLILEMVASGGAPLDAILEAIVLGIEAMHPDKLCSILLLDASGTHIVRCIAPSLPSFYNHAFDGMAVGTSSCGMAAFTGERVVVENIATHPFWEPFKTLAAQAELGAFWSQPIHSGADRVLGAFGIYHRKEHHPSDADIALIEQTARLVSISIEKSEAEEQIRTLAYRDSLTQLPNRRQLDDRLNLALGSSRRTGLHGAVMLLDLDNFKPLNDTHGHGVGDLLLIEVAQRLSSSVREVDTVARLGGDEFVVVIGDLDANADAALAQARIVAEKIRAALAQPYLLTVTAEAQTPTAVIEHHCSCSIGVTLFTGKDSQHQPEILKRADDAMYKAKQSGRNTIHA